MLIPTGLPHVSAMGVSSFVLRHILGASFTWVIRFLQTDVQQRQRQCAKNNNHRCDQDGDRESTHRHIPLRETIRFGVRKTIDPICGIVRMPFAAGRRLAGRRKVIVEVYCAILSIIGVILPDIRSLLYTQPYRTVDTYICCQILSSTVVR